MIQANPETKKLARLILAHRVDQKSDSFAPQYTAQVVDAAVSAWAELRTYLVKLVGIHGYNALGDRAIALAKRENGWIGSMRINPDGSWEGLAESVPQDPASAFEGFVTLMTQFLGLLNTLIGEALTLRLVKEVWPQAQMEQAPSDVEEETTG